MVNSEEVLNKVDIVDVINKYVPLKKNRAGFIGVCPFHSDSHASLKVSQVKQVYKCFACGKGGDAIDFLINMGSTFHQAVKVLTNDEDFFINPVKAKEIEKLQKHKWVQIKNPTSPPRKVNHPKFGKPNQVWRYVNSNGTTMGYICRFNTPEGKEIVPLVFASNGEYSSWRWLGFDTPRPLYNLNEIHHLPNRTILVTEGEKAADATAKLVSPVNFAVTSWMGGARAIRQTDWTSLAGRKVVLIPDNDIPGIEAMIEIAEILRELSCDVRFINTSSKPPKWDIADEENWTRQDCMNFLKENISHKPLIELKK